MQVTIYNRNYIQVVEEMSEKAAKPANLSNLLCPVLKIKRILKFSTDLFIPDAPFLIKSLRKKRLFEQKINI